MQFGKMVVWLSSQQSASRVHCVKHHVHSLNALQVLRKQKNIHMCDHMIHTSYNYFSIVNQESWTICVRRNSNKSCYHNRNLTILYTEMYGWNILLQIHTNPKYMWLSCLAKMLICWCYHTIQTFGGRKFLAKQSKEKLVDNILVNARNYKVLSLVWPRQSNSQGSSHATHLKPLLRLSPSPSAVAFSNLLMHLQVGRRNPEDGTPHPMLHSGKIEAAYITGGLKWKYFLIIKEKNLDKKILVNLLQKFSLQNFVSYGNWLFYPFINAIMNHLTSKSESKSQICASLHLCNFVDLRHSGWSSWWLSRQYRQYTVEHTLTKHV